MLKKKKSNKDVTPYASMPETYFKVGQIVNTHGLRGEVKVYPYTEEKEVYEAYEELLIEDMAEPLEIESIRYVKNMVLVKFAGLDDINVIEHLVQKNVFVPRDIYELPDEDTFFVVDLIGLEVVDEIHGPLGVLADILQNTAQDIYVVRRPLGEDILIPAVKAFVKKVDMEEKRITVTLIEGMI